MHQRNDQQPSLAQRRTGAVWLGVRDREPAGLSIITRISGILRDGSLCLLPEQQEPLRLARRADHCRTQGSGNSLAERASSTAFSPRSGGNNRNASDGASMRWRRDAGISAVSGETASYCQVGHEGIRRSDRERDASGGIVRPVRRDICSVIDVYNRPFRTSVRPVAA